MRLILFAKLLLVFAPFFFLSCKDTKGTSEVFIKDEGAINGYDAVAYFTESMPVKGDRKFKYRWREADWYFATENNLRTFQGDPERYAPQYGGYCAYGTAEGHKAPTDPVAWTIVNGRLFLNYNTEVMGLWTKDQQKLIEKADENWDDVKKQRM
jgi:YHS domain-containing protein